MGIEQPANPDIQSNPSPGYSSTGDGQSREMLEEITRQSRDAAQYVARQIKLRARTALSDQKVRLSRRLEAIGDSLRISGSKLREQDQISTAEIMEKSAEKVERLSNSLRRKDIDELVEGIEDLARKRPAVFAGLALAAGFVLGQVLSNSRGSLTSSHSEHALEHFSAREEERQREWH